MGIIHVDCITNAWLFWESQKGISEGNLRFPQKNLGTHGTMMMILQYKIPWILYEMKKKHEFCMNNIEQW